MSSTSPPPLPYRPLIVLSIALLSSAISITFLFPFLPFMVEDFGTPHKEIGSHAGWIGSGLFIGRVCSGIILGYLSDKYGRRPFLIGNLMVDAGSIVAFGVLFWMRMFFWVFFLLIFVYLFFFLFFRICSEYLLGCDLPVIVRAFWSY